MSAESPPIALTGRPARSFVSLRRLGRLAIYGILLVAVLFYVIPVYVLFITGMKSFTEVSLDRMWSFPSGFTLDSFSEAWKSLSPNFLNSVKVAVPAAVLSSILGSINGYILAKWRFRYSELLFTLILFGMFIPYQAILIPVVQLESNFGLYGSIPGLVIIHIIYGIPITTLIFRNYYVAIPEELIEAARIDGAGFFGIYFRILLPLSAPGFVVVLIWQFTSAWNDFLFAATLTNQQNWPVTVALNNLAGSFQVAWNVQMAGALIAALPTLLVYVLLGKFFMRGLLAGSLKG
ncbi:MAG: glucose/mannose transport system permease protein [Thermoleophilaceae bacterium]|nr:glucose/mannose transport system permease protein [Thermoleophilaceae bacterium]MEA2623022.1 glucose/mannose transport system permease protein [Chloroflexota bacterium]